MRKYVIVVFLCIIFVLSGCAPLPEPSTENDEGVLTFGGITVCKVNSEISFYATVKKDEGWVQHLLYLHGYQWLKEQSAIVSDARLPELQHAFAVLDWELWDELWQGIDSEKAYDVRIYIEHEGARVEAKALVNTADEIHVGDMIFLGCPYFDAVALGTAAVVDCTLCPVFPLEQEALNERFVRENRESGYEINTRDMFNVGSRVEVIIKVPKCDKGTGLLSRSHDNNPVPLSHTQLRSGLCRIFCSYF